MGREKGSGGNNIYIRNNYLINMLRLNMLVGKDTGNTAITTIAKENLIDYTMIQLRFKKIYDIDGKIIGFNSLEMYKNIDKSIGTYKLEPIILEIIKLMIIEGRDNLYIKENLELKLRRDGYKMVDNKLVKVEKSNEVLELAVDLGNNLVKVAYGEDKKFSFVNKIAKESSDTEVGDMNYIRMGEENDYMVIGRELDVFEKNKSKKEKNFLPTLYFAIAKVMREMKLDESVDEVDVKLALLTPSNQKSESGEYEDKIKEAGVDICEYRIDGVVKQVIINIKEINIYQEGMASYAMLEDIEKTQIVIDIGSGTLNYLIARNGLVQKALTEDDLGTFKYFQRVVSKAKNRDITIDNVQTMLEDGIIKHDLDELKDYRKSVLKHVDKTFKFTTANKVNITGGGCELFKSQNLSLEKGNIEVMLNASFTNVLGALLLMKA